MTIAITGLVLRRRTDQSVRLSCGIEITVVSVEEAAVTLRIMTAQAQLTRRMTPEETIILAKDISMKVAEIFPLYDAKLYFTAPRTVKIFRNELIPGDPAFIAKHSQQRREA